MNTIQSILLSAALVAMVPSHANTLTHPGADPQFLKLSSGVWLSTVKVSGVDLRLGTGTGTPFTASEASAYSALKTTTLTQDNGLVQWVLMDLDTHKVLQESKTSSKVFFGASASKIFVAGTLLNKQGGQCNAAQLQLLADMQVISSNTAWVELQTEAGDGDADRGRANNYAFTQKLGYSRTRGYQGNWGQVHGNELVAREIVEYLYDMYQGHFPGAEIVWKLMHTSRTGAERARKYLPTTQYVGGKTGTYDGPTTDPDTGSPNSPDGKPFEVHVRHQEIVFNLSGHEYALSILADTGSDESAALLAGGLYRELQQNPP